MVALILQSPGRFVVIAHSSQWSRSVVAGAAALRFLAYWASASLHPALITLGSAPNFYAGRFQAASRRSASVLFTLWRMGFHSAFWNSAATETGR